MKCPIGKGLKAGLVLFLALLMSVVLIATPLLVSAATVVDVSIDADPTTTGIQNTIEVPTAGVGVHFFVNVVVENNTQASNAVACYILFDKAVLAAGSGANNQTIFTGTEVYTTPTLLLGGGNTIMAGVIKTPGDYLGGNTYTLQAADQIAAGDTFHAEIDGTVVTGALSLANIAGAKIEFHSGAVAQGTTTLAGGNIVAGTSLKGNTYTIGATDQLGLGTVAKARILSTAGPSADFVLTNLAAGTISFYEFLGGVLGAPTVDTTSVSLPVGKGMVKFTLNANAGEPLPVGTWLMGKVEFSTLVQIGAGGTPLSFSNTDPIKTEASFGAGTSVLDATNGATITQNPGVTYTVDITSPQTAGVAANMTVTVKEGVVTKTNYVGTIQFSSTDANVVFGGDINPTTKQYTFTSGAGLDNGVHTFTGGVTFKTAGTRTVTGTDTVTPTITGTSGNITVNPNTASKLVFTTQPASAGSVDAAFGTQPVVQVQDLYGNLITTDNTTSITLAAVLASDDTTAGTGTMRNNTMTVTGGIATFATVGYSKSGETIHLKATSTPALTQAVSTTDITLTVGNAAKLVFTTQPATTGTVDAAFTTQPVVQVQDQYGNLRAADNATALTLSAVLAADDTTAGTGTIRNGTMTVTGGIATFTTVGYSKSGETIHISVTSVPALTPAVSTVDITCTVGAANKLVFTTQPAATGSVDAAFSTQPVVQVQDQYGNLRAADNATALTLSAVLASDDTTAGTGTIRNGTMTVTGGVATFTTLGYSKSGEAIHIKVTSVPALTQAVSTVNINLAVGTATKLVFTTQPAAIGSVDAAFSTQPVVQVQDQYGNLRAADNTTSLTLSAVLATNDTTAGTGTLRNNTMTVTGGIATFTTLGYSKSGETIHISVISAPVLTPAVSTTDITLTPGAATTLGVVCSTTTPVVNVAFNVTVTAKDQFNNTATGYVGNVAITTSDVGVGVVIPAAHTYTTGAGNDNGVYIFTGMKLQTLGAQTVTATDTVNGAITGFQNVTVSTIIYVITITSPQNAGTAANMTVEVTEGGVRKTDYTGIVQFTSNDAQVVFGGGINATTGQYTFTSGAGLDNGIHTFTGGVTFKTAGTRTVTGTDTVTGVTGTSGNVTVNPLAANKLVFTTQPASAGTVDAAFGTQPVVQVQDTYGNLITTDNTTSVTLSAVLASNDTTAGTGTMRNNAMTVTGGIATFTTAGYSKSGETIHLKATSTPTLTQAVSTTDITLTVGNAAKLAFTTQPATTGTVDAAFTTQPVVQVQDQYGNLRAADNATALTLAAVLKTDDTTAGTGTLRNGTMTVTGGIATFTTVGYSKSGEAIHIKVTSVPALTQAVSTVDITCTVGAANKLVFTTQPASTGTVDVAFTTQPVVQVQDQYGNLRAADSATSITLAAVLAADDTTAGAGTIRNGTMTVTGGVATFTALGYSKSGEAIHIKATSTPALTQAVSTVNITLTPGAATTLGVAASTVTPTKNVAFNVVVTAKDQYSNTATTYVGTVAITTTDTGTGVVLPANHTFTTGAGNDNGVYTFTGMKLQTYGNQTITARDTVANTITGAQTVNVVPVIKQSYNLGIGWNLFSVPFSLEDGYRSWGELVALRPTLSTNAQVAYYYNSTTEAWVQITSTYDMAPCDAIYIKMTSADSVDLVDNSMPSVPSKSLKAGWNLIGLGLYDGAGMDADDALVSVYTVAGTASTGYSQVVSPALNQTGWLYLRDNVSGLAPLPKMLPAKGYWVLMTNPGLLGGFTTTPLP